MRALFISRVATASGPQALALRVYVGPKDYDDLKHMNPPLHGLVNFGWMEFIADPLFHALKWLHNYIPNWGWAIVVLTLIINMLLFPLRISSYKTTLKMQRGLGLTLGNYFKLRAEETALANPLVAKAQSLIHIYLPGGCAHQDGGEYPRRGQRSERRLEHRGGRLRRDRQHLLRLQLVVELRPG